MQKASRTPRSPNNTHFLNPKRLHLFESLRQMSASALNASQQPPAPPVSATPPLTHRHSVTVTATVRQAEARPDEGSGWTFTIEVSEVDAA